MAAVATDPQSLANSVACYECGGDAGRQMLLMLALLRQIVLNANPVAAVDPQSLMNQANCYLCYGGPGTWQLFMLALLAQIAQTGTGGGGGGTGTQVIGGDTAAPDAGDTPANPAAAALYYFTDAGGIGNQTLYQWNIAAQNWTQLV